MNANETPTRGSWIPGIFKSKSLGAILLAVITFAVARGYDNIVAFGDTTLAAYGKAKSNQEWAQKYHDLNVNLKALDSASKDLMSESDGLGNEFASAVWRNDATASNAWLRAYSAAFTAKEAFLKLEGNSDLNGSTTDEQFNMAAKAGITRLTQAAKSKKNLPQRLATNYEAAAGKNSPALIMPPELKVSAP